MKPMMQAARLRSTSAWLELDGSVDRRKRYLIGELVPKFRDPLILLWALWALQLRGPGQPTTRASHAL